MLDKSDIHSRLEAPVLKDYGVYLAVDRLLACQKPLAAGAQAVKQPT